MGARTSSSDKTIISRVRFVCINILKYMLKMLIQLGSAAHRNYGYFSKVVGCINFVIILQVVYAHLLVNIYTISPFICII